MFQIKPYADKPSAFGLSVHSFVSYERIGKWDEDRYRKGSRKPKAGWKRLAAARKDHRKISASREAAGSRRRGKPSRLQQPQKQRKIMDDKRATTWSRDN